jgi:hypothetical protein
VGGFLSIHGTVSDSFTFDLSSKKTVRTKGMNSYIWKRFCILSVGGRLLLQGIWDVQSAQLYEAWVSGAVRFSALFNPSQRLASDRLEWRRAVFSRSVMMTGIILETTPQQPGLKLLKEGIIIQKDWKGLCMNASTSAIIMHLIIALSVLKMSKYARSTTAARANIEHLNSPGDTIRRYRQV